jgi:hypothetical protein
VFRYIAIAACALILHASPAHAELTGPAPTVASSPDWLGQSTTTVSPCRYSGPGGIKSSCVDVTGTWFHDDHTVTSYVSGPRSRFR